MFPVSYTLMTFIFTKPVEAQDCHQWEHSTHRTRHLEKENKHTIRNILYIKKMRLLKKNFSLDVIQCEINTFVEGKWQSALLEILRDALISTINKCWKQIVSVILGLVLNLPKRPGTVRKRKPTWLGSWGPAYIGVFRKISWEEAHGDHGPL